MSGRWHIVQQGESVESIAIAAGHWPETVWHARQNSQLRSLRREPDILLPGDRLFIPAVIVRNESRPTEQRHRFVRRGIPSRLRVKFVVAGRPRGNASYTITIDGENRSGTTDRNGFVDQVVSPTAIRAVVHFSADSADAIHTLWLRHLNPVTELSGVQMRLRSLGYNPGRTDGVNCAATQSAVSAFQLASSLPRTGVVDDTTRARLRAEYGS